MDLLFSILGCVGSETTGVLLEWHGPYREYSSRDEEYFESYVDESPGLREAVLAMKNAGGLEGDLGGDYAPDDDEELDLTRFITVEELSRTEVLLTSKVTATWPSIQDFMHKGAASLLPYDSLNRGSQSEYHMRVRLLMKDLESPRKTRRGEPTGVELNLPPEVFQELLSQLSDR